MDVGTYTRPPRGALVVIAIGLIATLAAAALATDEVGGSSVEIEWVARAPIPDSPAAAIPGGGSMQLGEGGLRVTEDNINGERVFRATSVLRVEAGSAVGQARVRCRMSGGGAELGRTVNSRGAFPRSSGEYNLTKQEVPESVGIRLPIQGAEFASLEMGDAFSTFTDLPGVVVSWQPHRTNSQEWQWGLPEGRLQEPLALGFASFWRSSGQVSVEVSCTLETGAGKAAVRTAGTLSR
ncbi:MAG TPA: hypothetical protein VFM94_02060 [Solirubrobacterales bacterium]|nr:hypothetical protein [Solirubrobacterales bacterium]